MAKPPLDLDAVWAFLLIAEFGNFTRAAEAMQTTQAAVSLKLKRLEERLGTRLVERTPRLVRLTSRGSAFLEEAQALRIAHDRAIAALANPRRRVAIGNSDHVAGPELPALIARMNANDPNLVMEIRIGSSAHLLQLYDCREIDAAIVRFKMERTDGKVIAEEQFYWFASPHWRHRADEPLPIASMAEPCGVRALSGKMLDDAEIAWTEIFVGGGVSAVAAAVVAGLGVAALAPRMLPLGVIDIGDHLNLPALPCLPIVIHARPMDEQSRDAFATLSAAFRSVTNGGG